MKERGQQGVVLVMLLVAGVVLPLLVTLTGAELAVPRNDSFAYSRVAEQLHETGSFDLIGYGRMLLISHVLWAQPFLLLADSREVATNLAGLTASAIAIAAYFALALRFVRTSVAALVVLVLVCFQGVAVNVPTFMTEPTALALNALALLAAVAALGRTGRSAAALVGVAIALSVASFAVREFAIVLLVAIVGVTAMRRPDIRRATLAAGFLGLLACGALYVWHSRLPGLEPTELQLGLGGLAWTTPGFVTLGLGLLPLTLVPALRLLSAPRRVPAIAGALIGGLIVVLAHWPSLDTSRARSVLADDIYDRNGASGQSLAIGFRPELLPPWAWLALLVLAGLGSIALGAVAASYLSQRPWFGKKGGVETSVLLLEVYAVLYLALIAVFGILGPLFSDRYLWPVVPILAILVTRVSVPSATGSRERLRVGHRASVALTTAAFVAVAAVAITYVQDSSAYDGARWRAGSKFVAEGASPTQVDAGLEWSGAHGTGVRDFDGHRGRPVTSEDPYWEGFWPPAVRCYLVSNERLDPGKYTVVGTEQYRTRLWTSERTLWRLRRSECP